MALKEKKFFNSLDHVLREIYECKSRVNLYWEIYIIYENLNL